MPAERSSLAPPPLGILFIDEQRLSPCGNVSQRIIDLVAQAVREVVERAQLRGFESGGEIKVRNAAIKGSGVLIAADSSVTVSRELTALGTLPGPSLVRLLGYSTDAVRREIGLFHIQQLAAPIDELVDREGFCMSHRRLQLGGRRLCPARPCR